MKPIEALKNMCENCERNAWARKQLCPFRSISNDYCEEYETLETMIAAVNSSVELLKKSGVNSKITVLKILEDVVK